MLDHMHSGDRVGHTFHKQAWSDMLAVFNAKFGSQYDKDVLKNRYTTLWKQFNDIKNLLDQSGFYWDDTQQMVVADNYVWDTYVEAHPDALYYRNKAVMNFNDLCLIYAYTTADGRYSRSSHDVDFDDEIQGVNTDDRKDGQIPAFGNPSRTYWTPPMDSYFVDLLLNQIQRDRRIGHALGTQAWNEISTLFNAKFESHFDKEVLKIRHEDLRHQYKEINALLDQNGFSWDETQKMVTAEDHVWESYIKAYPDFQLYKFKTMPSYHKLSVIYGDQSYNGRSSPMAYSVELNREDPVLMIEGTQGNADTDCSRADWTPSMDRYLIDLMLEQVRHKGHMINPIFNKQAWIDIVSAFKDRFGSHHDKYNLSGRHKSLRKLYNAMKNLLDLREFSWDEKRNLVTACDDAWDVYIKEHPDVKSFRTETKPSYNDLCVIYGNLTSNKRCNESNQDVNFIGYGRDIQAFPNGNCQRNGWTPPMDRYFIDLMLEQVRRGAMVDQNFSQQAWCHMLVKFNARFGFQHHRDALESRFQNLRKKFNDMKTLLDRNGFVWDEIQQMITADADLWDAFIVENPDAQSYRIQTLPNYNDLFLIFGKTITNGVNDHLNHCIYVEDSVMGVQNGQHDDQSSACSDIVGNDWTKPMDQFFIDLMLEQVLEGNTIEHTFNRQAWFYMMTSFNGKFGLHCDKYMMENRYLSLMKQYKDISSILSKNGFVWDEFQQMIRAEDDVWEAYIKENPDAVMYKDKIFESYSDLRMIFGNRIQDGRILYLDPEMELEHNNTLKMGMGGILEYLQSPRRNIETCDSRKKRRRSVGPLTAAFSREVKKISNGHGNNYRSMETIVGALEAVPDMDDELFLDACNLLEDEKKAKAFVKMDVEQRKKWLLSKLRV